MSGSSWIGLAEGARGAGDAGPAREGSAPSRLANLIARDQRRWAKAVKEAGITAE